MNKAKADAKAQSRLRRDEHIILRRLLTQLLSVRCIFEIACTYAKDSGNIEGEKNEVRRNRV